MQTRMRRMRNRRRWRRLFDVQRLRRDESGVQLVEAAIVLPIFLVLFAATAEFGRYFYEYTTLAKASRVGARYLSTSPVGSAGDTTAKNIVVYGNPSGTGSPLLPDLATSHVVITREGGVPLLPQRVTIKIVGYEHQPLFDVGALTGIDGLSTNVAVQPSVTMRYLLTQPPPL